MRKNTPSVTYSALNMLLREEYAIALHWSRGIPMRVTGDYLAGYTISAREECAEMLRAIAG